MILGEIVSILCCLRGAAQHHSAAVVSVQFVLLFFLFLSISSYDVIFKTAKKSSEGFGAVFSVTEMTQSTQYDLKLVPHDTKKHKLRFLYLVY